MVYFFKRFFLFLSFVTVLIFSSVSYGASNIQICGVKQPTDVYDYSDNGYLDSNNCNSLRMIYVAGDSTKNVNLYKVGLIDMSDLNANNSVAIYAGNYANIGNYAKILNISGNNVFGIYLTGSNSTALNNRDGLISCDGSINTYAMYGIKGQLINNGNIENCGRGMYIKDIGAVAVNNGTITCLNGTGIGMYAMNGATATNKGVIKDCATGMVSNGIGSNAINDGIIICYNSTGKGMQSLNGGTITNNVSITGCAGSVNSGNIDNGNINDGTIGSPSTVIKGLYICGIDTELLKYENKSGNTLECINKNVIEATNSNVYAINNGVIIVGINGNNRSIGMSALNGGSVVNNNEINVISQSNSAYGMYADGENSMAENLGIINCAFNGMIAKNGGRIYNNSLINKCNIAGMMTISENSVAINGENGVINFNSYYGSASVMTAYGGEIINYGLINIDDYYSGLIYGMNSKENSKSRNYGTITCLRKDPGRPSMGMASFGNSSYSENSGIINGCTTGMTSYEKGSVLINNINGNIVCVAGNVKGVGMKAEFGGKATNEGLIENCAIGMQSDGKYGTATAINAKTGVIKCANTNGIGMQSINGGIIKNEGTIIGCSDSPRVASDEPSISLAIAMADDETIPSTPSTGSTPRGALSYDIGYGVTASYINSGLTNQSMGGSFVEVTGSGTLAIKNSGTILCGSGLEECFGMNGTHNTTYEASVGAGNTMGSVIVLDDSTINIPQTSIIGGAIPDKEYTYKDVFVSSGGGSITGADNITSGSIVWNVTPVTNANSVDVIVTKNSYTDLASAEHSAIASVLEANYNGSNLYQSLNQKDIKSFNSALNQLSGADLSGGRGANLDSMSLINKADSGFNSRQDFISSYEGSYEKQSSFASNVGDITMGETQNQLTDNVTVRSVMAISQVSNNPLYNTYSYRYAGRVGLGKNYGFYTNTQLLQASSYNARTMDLGSGVSTLGRIENVTAIISDNYAYVSAKASDNVTLLAYSGASTSYSIFSNATEQASNTDMQFAALNLGGYNQTVVSAVIGQEIAYKSKANGTLSLMAKVSTPIMSIGNERTASFSTGESFIVNTGAEIGLYTATLGMNYLLGDTSTKGWNAKVSAYREINSIEINDNAYATLGYAF